MAAPAEQPWHVGKCGDHFFRKKMKTKLRGHSQDHIHDALRSRCGTRLCDIHVNDAHTARYWSDEHCRVDCGRHAISAAVGETTE